MCLNEEIVLPISQTQIAFERCCQDCGLSDRSIAAHVGRNPMTVSRIWRQWVQDGNTERHFEYQRPLITSSLEDRHTRMALMDHVPTS
ncbi:hypothetical protein TNCV_736081 [Trichonephila clavipes]|uniref:Uncharacterized protein n=1 Tax=Trichonephila clavipes TaxID=2585209 RepID=A0A8X6SYB7_TRICX|nr:hypothetical protein TNCV_736081 [Trichonephila clavipes]